MKTGRRICWGAQFQFRLLPNSWKIGARGTCNGTLLVRIPNQERASAQAKSAVYPVSSKVGLERQPFGKSSAWMWIHWSGQPRVEDFPFERPDHLTGATHTKHQCEAVPACLELSHSQDLRRFSTTLVRMGRRRFQREVNEGTGVSVTDSEAASFRPSVHGRWLFSRRRSFGGRRCWVLSACGNRWPMTMPRRVWLTIRWPAGLVGTHHARECNTWAQTPLKKVESRRLFCL